MPDGNLTVRDHCSRPRAGISLPLLHTNVRAPLLRMFFCGIHTVWRSQWTVMRRSQACGTGPEGRARTALPTENAGTPRPQSVQWLNIELKKLKRQMLSRAHV